ncbi:cellulase family glycosylhydrolase [Chitinophaga horti]|uniref:Cellulase family glycosylhydrolase n=1 Tax=Chitinophaga horti TaxID=2920382 RepID=A0ABY6J8A1_9BACT|nr:cellulase family glycosylhydrolase [Chitinophaga horti]UYQ94532.1 cellulase family glycosylhydrolase [Chitinophaga horti]
MLRRLLCGFTLAALMTQYTQAQGFLKTAGTRIVNEKNENVLLRGIGLGGWMLQEGYMLRVTGNGQQQYRIRERMKELTGEQKTQQFYNAWLANHTTRADIDSMKAWGFNSVRLPMHYNLYMLDLVVESAADPVFRQKGFDMTDSLLAWCKANNMYLILDLHAAPGGQGNDLNISDRDPSKPSLWQDRSLQERTIALWKKLAARYKDEPWIGGYDIINEPNWGFEDPENDKNGLKEKTNAPLRKLMMEITQAIRSVDKRHIIIIEGNGWGNNYNGIFPPWDNNMVLSYHKYWNYNDDASIAHIIKARDQYNIPVWLGETGENSNVWFTEAIRLLERNNIGWAWWPLKKLGHNNPLEIPMNDNYQRILDYWSGKAAAPSAEAAFAGMMQLASDANIRNNILHRDVIDAMIRQPFSPTAIPFKEHLLQERLVINAIDYDLGPNGVAYYDLDTANYRISNPALQGGNSGRSYRNDGVDISGSEVVNFEAGEWLQYTFTVVTDGKYKVSAIEGYDISVDGKPVSNLRAGRHTLRVKRMTGKGSLKEIVLERV